MEDNIKAALQEAAHRAGAVDPCVSELDAFADLRAGIHAHDGDVFGVAEAVAEMRRRKPHLFAMPSNWSDLSDDEFEAKREQLHATGRSTSEVAQPVELRRIDTSRLSASEFADFRDALRSKASQRRIPDHLAGRLKAMLARQLSQDRLIEGAA